MRTENTRIKGKEIVTRNFNRLFKNKI